MDGPKMLRIIDESVVAPWANDDVAQPDILAHRAAGTDADQLFDAVIAHELRRIYRNRWNPHPRALDGNGVPLIGSRISKHIADAVVANGAVQKCSAIY